jgi:hypothetical protein
MWGCCGGVRGVGVEGAGAAAAERVVVALLRGLHERLPLPLCPLRISVCGCALLCGCPCAAQTGAPLPKGGLLDPAERLVRPWKGVQLDMWPWERGPSQGGVRAA